MRRTLLIFAGLAVLTVALIPLTGHATPPPAAAAPAAARSDAAAAQTGGDTEAGRRLYFDACASCHGADLSGVDGRGPSLRDVGGAAAVTWAVSSGRMPLASPADVPRRGSPRFDESETADLAAFVGEQVGDADIPTARTAEGLLGRGRQLYADNCAACHGVNGGGSAIGGGYDAPSLHEPVDAGTVAQAMHIGPGRMPVFSGPGWPQADVNAVATYVVSLSDGGGRGGFAIGGRGPVSEGFVAWLIGLGLLVLAARLLGTRTPKRPPDPGAHE